MLIVNDVKSEFYSISASFIFAILSLCLVLYGAGLWLKSAPCISVPKIRVNFSPVFEQKVVKKPASEPVLSQNSPPIAIPESEMEAVIPLTSEKSTLPVQPVVETSEKIVKRQIEKVTEVPPVRIRKKLQQKPEARTTLSPKSVLTPKPVTVSNILPATNENAKNKKTDSSFENHPTEKSFSPLNDTAEAPPQPKAQLSVEARQKFLAQIRVLLERNKRYPPRARRRNLTGKVVLSFKIDPFGRAFDVKASNADHSSFTKAALQLVEQTRLPHPPEGWKTEFIVQIPIKYSLK